MIPTGWTPCTRPSDGELLGYLATDEQGTTPLTVFGWPLDGPLDRVDAEELLLRRGLAALAEPWWYEPDGGAGEEGGAGYPVQVLAAYPDRVVVARADYGFVSHDAPHVRLDVPAVQLTPYRR